MGLWWASCRIGRGPLAAALIFAGVLLPALGFFDVFPFRYSFVADHFQYHACLPLIALAAAAATVALSRLPKSWHWLLPLAGACVILPLAVTARDRTSVFHDRESLHEDTFAKNPGAWVAPLDLGKVAFEQGKYDGAITYDERGIDALEQLVRKQPDAAAYADLLAGSYINLGLAQQRAGRAADAERCSRGAVEMREKLTMEHPAVTEFQVGLAWAHANMAEVQSAAGKLADAEQSYEKAIVLRKKLADEDPSAGEGQDLLAATYVDLSKAQRAARRRIDAAGSLQQAIDVRRKLVASDQALDQWRNRLAATYVELGLLQLDLVQPAQAESSFRQAIEIRETLVQFHPEDAQLQTDLAWSYTHCAIVQQNTAQRTEAEASYRKAIALREKLAGDFPAVSDYKIQSATSYVDLGILQREMGGAADAVELVPPRHRLPAAIGRRKSQRQQASGGSRGQLHGRGPALSNDESLARCRASISRRPADP